MSLTNLYTRVTNQHNQDTEHSTIQKVFFVPIPVDLHSYPWPQVHHWSIFSHHTLDVSFLEFRINEIIQCVLFCFWFLLLSLMCLRFIHVVYMNQYFIALYYWIIFYCKYILQFCLSSYLLMNVLVVSAFGLLWIKLPWTSVWKSFCERVF